MACAASARTLSPLYGSCGHAGDRREDGSGFIADQQPRERGGWTFCVAEGVGGKDYWITDVFPASRERERLEIDLKAYLKGRGVAITVAQCPAPKDDKTDVVNAQFTAAEFHRKLGDALHEFSAPGFAPRR